eukprot:COSAG01_NODE_4172_length_5271_cov_19.601121_5_plen_138_part_00
MLITCGMHIRIQQLERCAQRPSRCTDTGPPPVAAQPRAKRPKATTRKVSGAPSKAAKRRGGKGPAKRRGSAALLPVAAAMRRLTAGRRLEYLFSRPAISDHDDHRGTQEFWLSGKIEGPCRKAKKSKATSQVGGCAL